MCEAPSHRQWIHVTCLLQWTQMKKNKASSWTVLLPPRPARFPANLKVPSVRPPKHYYVEYGAVALLPWPRLSQNVVLVNAAGDLIPTRNDCTLCCQEAHDAKMTGVHLIWCPWQTAAVVNMRYQSLMAEECRRSILFSSRR